MKLSHAAFHQISALSCFCSLRRPYTFMTYNLCVSSAEHAAAPSHTYIHVHKHTCTHTYTQTHFSIYQNLPKNYKTAVFRNFLKVNAN